MQSITTIGKKQFLALLKAGLLSKDSFIGANATHDYSFYTSKDGSNELCTIRNKETSKSLEDELNAFNSNTTDTNVVVASDF